MSGQVSQPVRIPPSRQMYQLIWPGAMAAQTVYVAAKIGLADIITKGPKTAEELARETNTHPPTLRRFLRALNSLGIFSEDATGRFHHTPLSETLRSNVPDSVRAWAIMLGAPFIWKSWGELHETVITGRPAFERIFGLNLFDHLAKHPDDGAIFDAAMSSQSSGLSDILSAYEFSKFDRIVDVGGGQGELLHGILAANPALRGILYDLPSVVTGATALRAGTIGPRCEIRAGNFFDSVPEGADAYVLKQIIHSWNDEDAIRILRNCRRAIRPDGTLIIIGDVLKTSDKPDSNVGLMDLMMLVLSPGRERTESEYATLLREAGFSLARVISRVTGSIIEAHPV